MRSAAAGEERVIEVDEPLDLRHNEDDTSHLRIELLNRFEGTVLFWTCRREREQVPRALGAPRVGRERRRGRERARHVGEPADGLKRGPHAVAVAVRS